MNYDLESFENMNSNVLVGANIMYLSYIPYEEPYIHPVIDSITEKKYEPDLSIGIRGLRVRTNLNKNNLDIVLAELSKNIENRIANKELLLDPEFLDNYEVIEFLRRESLLHNIEGIKIIGDNYTLDEETYRRLAFLPNIKVKNSTVQADNVEIEPRKFVENTDVNEDKKIETSFFVSEHMSEDEIKELINTINQNKSDARKLNIRFYNPKNCVDFIAALEKNGLDKDVNIDILGYPLAENAAEYDKILSLSDERKINVTYTCCHDLLQDYSHEPFLVCNRYVSDLEPDGKTDLRTYTHILQFLEKFESQIKDTNSSLEKVMEAYKYINDNYYYAAEPKKIPEGYTRDVDKIIDRDEIVCVGFANLLSIMCRRNNIPLFTYGAPEHKMNVGRILEKDENGNVIFDKICTFDPTNDCGYYVENNGVKEKHEIKDSYEFFGLSPETWLHSKKPSFITMANTLALSKEARDQYEFQSYDPYMAYYFGDYSSSTFLYSMIHLMGYNYDAYTTLQSDVISTLNAEGRIGEIAPQYILRAAYNIEKRNNPNMSPQEFEQHMVGVYDRISQSIIHRGETFSNVNPQIRVFNGNNSVNVEVETYEHDGNNYTHVDLDSIDIGPTKYQDVVNIPNGNGNEPNPNDPQVEAEVQQQLNPGNNEGQLLLNPGNNEGQLLLNPGNNEGQLLLNPGNNEGQLLLNSGNNEGQLLLNSGNNEGQLLLNSGNDEGQLLLNTGNQGNMPNSDDEQNTNGNDNYIAGTLIKRPRERNNDETDEEYSEYLSNYYEQYFPKAVEETNTVYHLGKDEIIQDLPIYSLEEQTFQTPGMTPEEIFESMELINPHNNEENNDYTYHLTHDQIIQDDIYNRDESSESKGISR